MTFDDSTGMDPNDPPPLSDLTLWTGGWDSTYRVLHRAVVERRPVRPVYVVDRGRASTPMEIGAINGLLLDLEQSGHEAYDLIEPPRFVDRQAIPPDSEVEEAFAEIKASVRARGGRPLGSQYEWLPRLARSAEWTGVELSVYGAGHLGEVFGPHLERGADGVVRLRPGADAAVRVLLEPFALPLWGGSKAAALADADRKGLTALLNAHTWFCFRPRGGRPCGECNPCLDVMADGLSSRVPLDRRLTARARRAFSKARFQAGALRKKAVSAVSAS